MLKRKAGGWILSLAAIAMLGFGVSVAPAAQGEAPKAESPKASAAKAETLTGTLTIVQADKKLVVVTNSSGIPFSFKVTGTRITVNGQKAKLADLSSQTNKQATVKYVPSRSGNVAKTIEIGS
jgi:ABC-type amino acid transport substrate-binding protein